MGDTFAVTGIVKDKNGNDMTINGKITGNTAEKTEGRIEKQEGRLKLENVEITSIAADDQSLFGGGTPAAGSTVEIKNCTASMLQESVLYTGKEVYPGVKVSYNGKDLVENEDYALSYADNVKVGTATVTILGMGKYAGQTQLQFAIVSELASQPTPEKVVKYSAKKGTIAAKSVNLKKKYFSKVKNIAKYKITKGKKCATVSAKGILTVKKTISRSMF